MYFFSRRVKSLQLDKICFKKQMDEKESAATNKEESQLEVDSDLDRFCTCILKKV